MIKYLLATVLFAIGFCSCSTKNKASVPGKEDVLTGTCAKLWIVTHQDSNDCNCYYALLFRSGEARYMLRDRKTGRFIDWFNELSGDEVSDNTNWQLNNDTLTITGLVFRMLNVSKNSDGITLQEARGLEHRKLYLVDAKLMNVPHS